MNRRALIALATAGALATSGAAASTALAGRADQQTTDLISRALDGGIPNGPSTNGVISRDKRYARVIGFQSTATNLVAGDNNPIEKVFAVIRAGGMANNGAPWSAGRTVLVSRGLGGQPANGPSYAPAVDGGFHHLGSCVAFLSAASNLVPGDTNGKVDAFVSRGPGGAPQRVSLLPGKRQVVDDVTQVAVSGDCKRVAFVAGGRVYVRAGKRIVAFNVPGPAGDPSFSPGLRNDMVFAGARGVYLSKDATKRPKLIVPGASEPAYNDLKRRVVAYQRGGQLFYRDLGGPEHLISGFHGQLGSGESGHPVIGNAGYYVTFQTDAGNLGTNAGQQQFDANGRPDVYLYTDVRKLTLAQSVEAYGRPLPGGGENPSMSFYANYIVFDTPAPLGSVDAPHQVFMRYLGGL